MLDSRRAFPQDFGPGHFRFVGSSAPPSHRSRSLLPKLDITVATMHHLLEPVVQLIAVVHGRVVTFDEVGVDRAKFDDVIQRVLQESTRTKVKSGIKDHCDMIRCLAKSS